MNAWRILKVLLLVLGSGAAGWWMHAPAPSPAPVSAAAKPAPAQASPRTAATSPAVTLEAAPMIALASDGNVTLRVEQRPLEWVLEQIALQAGGSPDDLLRLPARGTTPAARDAEAACVPAAPPDARAEPLLRTIERGDEAARHDGLLQARGAGIAVPDETLKTLFETDASDRVRLLAFESWLETRADNADAMRSALQAALYLPSAAIQNEARRLLSQLQDVERIDADSAQSTSP